MATQLPRLDNKTPNNNWKSIRVNANAESPTSKGAPPTPALFSSPNNAQHLVPMQPMQQPGRFFPAPSVQTFSSQSTSSSTTMVGPGFGPPPHQIPPRHHAQKVELAQPKLQIVKDASQLPVPTLLSEVTPVRDFSLPAHKYPVSRNKVDSRAEAKVSQEMRQLQLTSPRGAPMFVGTTFTHLPNSRIAMPSMPPPRATLPRMYPALTGEEFAQHGALLNNRTVTGKILGNIPRRTVSDKHVPYLPPEEPVGPDNLYVAMNDIWTKCWDKEAGAVYYYNQKTGEATWIAPEI